MPRTRRAATFLAIALGALVACGGSPAPVASPVAASTAAPTTAAAPAPPAAVEAPRELALWAHVETPSALVPALRTMLDPGDLAWLDAVDLAHPIDMAAWASQDKDGVAAAFSVTSREKFETVMAQDADVKDLGHGRLRLEAKKGDGDSDGKELLSGLSRTLTCELTTQGSGELAVCGDEHGMTHLAPWLHGGPKPPAASPENEAIHVEVNAAPILARALAGKDSGGELMLLAHDWSGASLGVRLAGDSVAFRLDARFGSTNSGWTKALLADTSSAPMPDTFGRMPDGAGLTFASPGGAVLGALVRKITDQLGTIIKPEVARPVLDDLDSTILSKAWVSASYIDADEAHAALAQLRKSPNDAKAVKAVKAAFEGYELAAGSMDAKALEALVRDLTKALPADKSVAGQKLTMSTAPAPAALGLPKGSVVLSYKTTSAPEKGRKAPPPPPKIEQVVFVPDGSTFWSFSGADLPRAARLAKRLLALPVRPLAPVPEGAFLTGSVGSKLGAYWTKLEGLDVAKADARLKTADELQKSLEEPATSIPFAIASKKDGSGGTVTITLSGSPAAMKKVGENLVAPAAGLAMGVFMLAAMSGLTGD